VETATARYWAAMERHKLYISEHGDDMPEVRDWKWSQASAFERRPVSSLAPASAL